MPTKSGAEHSHDRQRKAVERQATTHRADGAAEHATCQPVADHRHARARRRLIVLTTKRTPGLNANAQHVEEVGRDPPCLDDDGWQRVSGEAAAAFLNAGDGAHGLRRSPQIVEIQVGHTVRTEAAAHPLAHIDHAQAIGFDDAGRRTPEQPIADAEHRGCGTDGEAERNDHGRCERRGSAERTDRMPDVLPARLHPSSASRRARRREVQRVRQDLFETPRELSRCVEVCERCGSCGCRFDSAGNEILDAVVKMLGELFDDLCLVFRLQAERSQPLDQFASPE